MKKTYTTLLMLVALASAATAKIGNPFINHRYAADPSARVFGDTLWVYPSHDKDDAPNFDMEDYHVYSTTDMQQWQDHGPVFNPLRQTQWAKSAAWAPDCIERNGKYYLYYPTDKRHIGVAVGDTPHGPFRDPLGHPLLSIDTPGVICDRDFIDPCVFIDDDGQAYLFAGQNTVCCVRLNADMISYSGPVHIIQGATGFFEAVWVHKRNGIYYMSYSTSPFTGQQPKIAYATSRNPLGPYKYQGEILGPVNSGTNHHSIVTFRGQDYLFYHTADISRHLNASFHSGVRRNICCDSLFYHPDGTIQPVRPTLDSMRVRMAGVDPERRMTLTQAAIRPVKIPQRDFHLSGPCTRYTLQTIIDRCSAQGGGRVIVPAGKHNISGPISLRNDVCLHLCDSAQLIFSSDPDAYLPTVLTRWEGTECYNRSSMIRAEGCHNIAITGEGTATIDANGGIMARWGMPIGTTQFQENIHGTHGETPEKKDVDRLRQMGDNLTPVSQRVFGAGSCLRPCAIEFFKCSQILVQGITLKNSPFWCIHPVYCEDVTVRRVDIYTHYPNNDGCDPESSNRVLIERCFFVTGDDAVAIKSGRDADGRRVGIPSQNIIIRDCSFRSECNGLCIGSEMSGGVRNVFMKNVDIRKVKNGLLFKSNLDRGGYIENVYVDSVSIMSVAGAVLRFETNYFGYRGGNFPARYSDFVISNVRAQTSDAYAIYYDGNEAEPIRNIKVSNFNVDKAPHPHYLFKTQNCTFHNCTVNGFPVPLTPPEDSERRSCDVW